MDFEAQATLMCYEKIAPLNESHNICIVRHTGSGKIFVRKTLKVFSLSVYEALKEHPIANTPHIEELISDEDTLIIVEEYISGNTLSEVLSGRRCLSEEEAARITLLLCRIVEDLHSVNPPIIHRDIKPSNVMIRYDGSVCLLDFNAAKYEAPSQERDTVLLGTSGYAAPEQYGFGASNERTDIYALGKLLSTMLTGDVEDTFITSTALSRIIAKATSIDPQDRYADIPALAQALCKAVPAAAGSVGSMTGSSVGSMTGGSVGSMTGGLVWEDSSAARSNPPIFDPSISWIPPGFRTRNPVHMLAAVFGYLFILWYSLTYQSEGSPFAETLWDRTFYLLSSLAIVAFTCNYRGIGRFNLFHRSPSRRKRNLGIFLTDLLIFVLMVFLLALGTDLFC